MAEQNIFTRAGQAQAMDPAQALAHHRLKDLAVAGCMVTPGDQLRVYCELATGVIAAVTSVALLVGGRVMDYEGQLSTFQESKTFVADGAQTVFYIRAAEGCIVDLSVSTTTTGLQTGDVAVTVELVQGESAAPTPLSTLASGWVTKIAPLGLGSIQEAF